MVKLDETLKIIRSMGLDAVELVMAIEEGFEIKIPDAEAGEVLTPRDLCDIVELKLIENKRSMSKPEIQKMMQQIITEQLSIDNSEYHIDKELVRDLGMD